MNKLVSLFLLYKSQGIIKASWTVLRILILPYKKLDSLIPENGTIVDIGCGNGGLDNYISLSSYKRKVLGIDLSKKRIASAKKTVKKRNNIEFKLGNAVLEKLPKADCFILVDVLHHIDFQNQEKILKFLAKKLDANTQLIIKEIDPSDKIPFVFGQLFEKILYPKEKIYARSKKDWQSFSNP